MGALPAEAIGPFVGLWCLARNAPLRRRQGRCSQQPCAARAKRGVQASTTVGEGEPAARVIRASDRRTPSYPSIKDSYLAAAVPALALACLRAGPRARRTKSGIFFCQALAARGWIRTGSLPRDEADVFAS